MVIMATSLSMSMLDADDRTKKYSLPFNGGVFRMSTVEWPNWYVYMQSNGEGNVRGWEGLPGYQGELIFTPDTSNSELFLISTKTWPDWYIHARQCRWHAMLEDGRAIQVHKAIDVSLLGMMVRLCFPPSNGSTGTCTCKTRRMAM